MTGSSDEYEHILGSLQFKAAEAIAFDLVQCTEDLINFNQRRDICPEYLSDGDIKAWLERPARTQHGGSQPITHPESQHPNIQPSKTGFTGRLRFLYVVNQVCAIPMPDLLARTGICSGEQLQTLPFKKGTFQDLLESMCIPIDLAVVVITESPLTAVFTNSRTPTDKSQVFNFVFKIGLHASGYITIAVSYSPLTKTTDCLLLTQTGYADRDALTDRLERHRNLWGQPMLVPVLSAQNVVELNAEKILDSHRDINHWENELHLHRNETRPLGDLERLVTSQATRSASIATSTLAIAEMRLEGIILLLTETRKNMTAIQGLSKEGRDDDRMEDVQSRRLLEIIDNLENHCKYLLLTAVADQKRAATIVQVVSTYMAQRSEAWNMRIATASKRDSSAAASIALLTMAVLPATFVATFFAMPLFDWNAAPGESIFKPRFSIYWKVVIPLTVGILFLWALWTGWRMNQSKRDLEGELKKVKLDDHAGNEVSDWGLPLHTGKG